MRRLGSLVMRVAEASRVPAGAALAVDRERFAGAMTRELSAHPRITIVREEVVAIPESTDRDPVIMASGPLTSEALSAELAHLVGQEHLYFYDAISPIVLAETIDPAKVFRASRWSRDDGRGDYLNCPLTAEEYGAFLRCARPRRVSGRFTTSTESGSSRAACRSK